MKCSICSSAQVNELNVLLASGSSVRRVAQLYGLSRTTLGRHRAHVRPLERRFGVIDGQDGPSGPGDPLVEALALAEQARTPRERLRALEQVRGATKLALHGAEDPDEEGRELLDRNIREAEAAYRGAGDFETQARALSGWREAIHQRIAAVRVPGMIDVPFRLTFFDAEEGPPEEAPDQEPGHPWRLSLEQYFNGILQRFRDPDRFVVRRTLRLRWPGERREPADGQVDVFETATGALAWTTPIPTTTTTGRNR